MYIYFFICTGMASLDKYQFVEGRQGSGKKRDKKHKKRSKKRGVASSSSDEVRPIKVFYFCCM